MLSVGFNAFVAKPDSNFIDTDHKCFRPLRNRLSIAYVVAVSVADEDEVCFDCVRGNGSDGIPIQEGIDDDLMAVSFQSEGGMPIPGEFCGHENLLFV